jgi:hypothetical protein
MRTLYLKIRALSRLFANHSPARSVFVIQGIGKAKEW